jgi:hypothetical protein
MDLKTFLNTLIHGTPFAILAAAVGVLWQAAYVLSRDRIHDKQARRELNLEQQKFEHQRKLEDLRFQYEQRRWREQLACDLTVKLVEARLDEYSKVWSYVEGVSRSQHHIGAFTAEAAKSIAEKIKLWRYSKGGLLAEETTRSAAMAFQKALFSYDGSDAAYRRVRKGRFLFRDAIRADMGLTDDIFQIAEKRQKVREELNKLQSELGMGPDE